MPEKLVCRAKISPACYDGQDGKQLFGDDWGMAEDGTYDGETIICDPCYIALMPYTPSGKALGSELPAALERARKERR